MGIDPERQKSDTSAPGVFRLSDFEWPLPPPVSSIWREQASEIEWSDFDRVFLRTIKIKAD
jgi:hypothetical protein